VIPLDESTNVFVCGPVCSGKTNLLNVWLEKHNRYVRFDYTGETTGNPGIEHVYNPSALLDRLEKNPYYYRLSYHPGKNVMEHYRWCQRAIWMFPEASRVLAMDEYHRVCPQIGKLDEDVETCLRMARHNQLGIIGLSQRPQDVHKLFVDSCRRCIIYRSQEGNFLDACANHWGDDVAECVEQLRPLVYNDVTKECKQVPQCVVVTRDGALATVYDFQTDSSVYVNEFLEGKRPEHAAQEEPSDNELTAPGGNHGAERAPSAVREDNGTNPNDEPVPRVPVRPV
jgi:hypothetical protein